MTFTDALVVLGVLGSFAFLIWSRLVQRKHPIVAKVQEMLSKPKEKVQSLSESERWQRPDIDKKIY